MPREKRDCGTILGLMAICYDIAMSLILWIVIILVVLNLLGYLSIPEYTSGRYYLNLPVLLVIILILYLLGVR